MKIFQRAAVFLLVLLLVSCRAGMVRPSTPAARFGGRSITVVVDAGHGGEDCGATGVNGVREKDLNFSVANQVTEMLLFAGVPAVRTRTEDKLLYRPEENIPGRKKSYDLRNRLLATEEWKNPVLLSIHMNNFTQEKYSGFQVYYSVRHPDSRVLAEKLQADVVRQLQPENRRQAKAGDSSIYLLDRAICPALLAECGFLSNCEECEKLCEEDYQKQLSFLLFCAMIDYSEEEPEEPPEKGAL